MGGFSASHNPSCPTVTWKIHIARATTITIVLKSLPNNSCGCLVRSSPVNWTPQRVSVVVFDVAALKQHCCGGEGVSEYYSGGAETPRPSRWGVTTGVDALSNPTLPFLPRFLSFGRQQASKCRCDHGHIPRTRGILHVLRVRGWKTLVSETLASVQSRPIKWLTGISFKLGT